MLITGYVITDCIGGIVHQAVHYFTRAHIHKRRMYLWLYYTLKYTHLCARVCAFQMYVYNYIVLLAVVVPPVRHWSGGHYKIIRQRLYVNIIQGDSRRAVLT